MKNMFIPGLKLRWLNVQCYEMVLPNGKVILFDPQFADPLPEDEDAKNYKIPEEFGITADIIERVDYLIINHSHCDHVIDIGTIANKFNPIIICHQSIAYNLAKSFDLPFTSIFAVGDQEKYEFEDFELFTFHGSHMPMNFRYSNMPNIFLKSYGMDGPDMGKLGQVGGIFNLNYGIRTHENIKIGFWGGRLDSWDYPAMKQMREFRPNVLLRQIPPRLPENPEKVFAREMLESGAQLLLPMHHEMYDIHKKDYLVSLFEKINAILREQHFNGSTYVPDRGVWLQIGFGVRPMEKN